MRRIINYDDYMAKRRGFLETKAALRLRRAEARQRHDPEERKLLMPMDKRRWEMWLSTGKLEKLGPRAYGFS